MILETYGLIKSVFPFIKEIFLWRDGAEEGKPITKKDLTRRKIATYVMAASLFFNYFLAAKTIHLGAEVVDLRKHEVTLTKQLEDVKKNKDADKTDAKSDTTKDLEIITKHIKPHPAHVIHHAH